MSLTGQWSGTKSDGSYIKVNLIESQGEIEGTISELTALISQDKKISIWGYSTFIGTINETSLSGVTHIIGVYTIDGRLLSKNQIVELEESYEIKFNKQINFSGELFSGRTAINVKTYRWNNNSKEILDSFAINKSIVDKSIIESEVTTWNEFKSFILTESSGKLFRGQEQDWALQTSFHRFSHSDIPSYLDNEFKEVEHHINSSTNNMYDTNTNASLAKLLHLAQHHGYPTPLLDWTKSPYIAAFFAFHNAKENNDGNVSIFIFDDEYFKRNHQNKLFEDIYLYTPINLVLSLELSSFNNPRTLPQQSVTMFSNINNIELYLQGFNRPKILRRVCIPIFERKMVLKELQLMGISWNTMFPGLDGVCKNLKWQHFEA
ncbi:FRG domain-containing protein [Kangiella sp. HZ709]|uniref:FRG domain-containing protein n=1 Tax=Kangiella sp. HZ709 TaxID=2666328 RepID=UPI0012AF2CA0|nr:FRG domain-containing protein [Kangiella sp. HZ709]MRX26890.1 FRG domain-containing protein [Kangiella sp. HZ709]